MVVLRWKLHSDHDPLPIPAGAQLEDRMGRTIIFILRTLIPIVFNFW